MSRQSDIDIDVFLSTFMLASQPWSKEKGGRMSDQVELFHSHGGLIKVKSQEKEKRRNNIGMYVQNLG